MNRIEFKMIEEALGCYLLLGTKESEYIRMLVTRGNCKLTERERHKLYSINNLLIERGMK